MAQNKRVLITGATSGVGLAAAIRFGSGGYEVIATARSAEKAALTKQAFAERRFSVEVVELDVRDPEAIHNIAQTVLAQGPLDVLVNNAGVPVRGPLDQADEAAMALQFETNVLGPIRLIREIAPAMRERQSGAIINISSAAGFMAQPYSGLYAASKHAMEGFSEALHWELQPFGVRVAIMQLGRFDTPIHGKNAFTAGLEPGNPHWPHYVLWHERTEERLYRGPGQDPAMAADKIFEAATTNSPRLRWLVGADVEAGARWRATKTFEEYEQALRGVLGLETA